MTMIDTRKGAFVRYGGAKMKVVTAASFESLTVQSPTGEYFDASLADLEAEAAGQPRANIVVDVIRQAKVPAYLKAFGPLLGRDRLTKAEVARASAEVGISVSSGYQVLARFRLSGSTDELPPPTRPGGRGKSRLDERVERVIQDHIDKMLLNRRNFTPRAFYKAVNRELQKLGLHAAQATLRKRVADIPPYAWKKSRRGHTETRRTEDPIQGEYPNVHKPLDAIQIDHWKADIEILSDDRLEIIGRVWITVAIDVYSRMVVGMHVGIDSPSTTTLGLCMINAMLRKDAIAKKYGLTWDNPIHGPIGRLEADNAGEFTGRSIKASAKHFNIHLKWRPLGAPQYGAYIERLNGVLAQEFKDLPGATGATQAERKAFRPEMTAAFTLEDLTRHVWLIIDEYHNTPHTGVGMTPLEKYKSYFFGPNGQKHRLPPVYIDNLDFRLHWYPLVTRSMQRYGIRIDYLDYYSLDLAHLVKNRKKGERLQVRRNPFDVREIYVYHPTREEWITVPTRHLNFPIASIYELQQARKECLKRKRQPTPELLGKIVDERQRHIEEAKKKTKTAQREATRRSHHDRIRDEDGATSARKTPTITLTTVPKTETAAASHNRTLSPVLQPPPPDDISSILTAISDDDIEELFQ
jgi:putative transposase